MRRNGSIRSEKELREIVYSVGIGPPQPKFLLYQSLPQTVQPSEFVGFVVKRYRAFASYFVPADALADIVRLVRYSLGIRFSSATSMSDLAICHHRSMTSEDEDFDMRLVQHRR
jgi:hypothetical protein